MIKKAPFLKKFFEGSEAYMRIRGISSTWFGTFCIYFDFPSRCIILNYEEKGQGGRSTRTLDVKKNRYCCTNSLKVL